MKFNEWTIGLAAVGVVSLTSVARAEEKMNAVDTAVSGTTISGYVDTSAQWNPGTGNENLPPYKFNNPNKADGFNLDVVQLTIAKPLDEAEWASGYHVDLWFGPDANRGSAHGLGTTSGWSSSSDFAIRQAYVELRTPVGNGIDWKVGVFDSVLGYESVESGNNPNYTRSYGHSIEPQTHTGVLATYHVNDVVSLSAGVADTIGPRINERAFEQGDKAESFKTYMGSIALTAPQSWGSLAGSTLYAGVVNGYSDSYGDNETSWYLGSTIATPVAGLKFGASFDYLDEHHWGSGPGDGNTWAADLYASFQATEKLSLHLRGEYLDDQGDTFGLGDNFKVEALTATVQYDLWKNVISRLEFRWDHGDNAQYFGTDSLVFNGESYSYDGPSRRNAFMLAANVIYKF